MTTTAQLRELQRARTFVRITRSKLERGHSDGLIVGISAKLLALALLGDGIRPDGFNIVRRDDVTKLQAPTPHARFYWAALKLRGETFPRLPKLDLTSWRTVVESAARRFPLITVHRESIDPGVCHIGRPLETTARQATFLTIDPDAQWDRDDPMTFRWSTMTRIDLGGAYEEALALVAASAR